MWAVHRHGLAAGAQAEAPWSALPQGHPPSPPSLPCNLQASQLAAQVFVAGGPAALTAEVCRLLQDGVEKEAAEPACLAQATAAMESLVRLGQPLEPVVAIARALKRQRDEAQQSAHQHYNCSQAAQGAARTAQQKLQEAEAAWAKERSELQAQADKTQRLKAVAAKWGATSQ